jgi:hypothetical protein
VHARHLCTRRHSFERVHDYLGCEARDRASHEAVCGGGRGQLTSVRSGPPTLPRAVRTDCEVVLNIVLLHVR